MSGQIAGSAALGAAVVIGSYVIQGILGDDTPWVGLAAATFTTGSALMAQVLSRRMGVSGRRPGLAMGYALATAGGVIAAVGAQTGWLVVFVAGLFLFGSGQAANLLARYAAADLAAPEHRSRDMSRVVFASTFGAVLGPVLVVPAEHAGEAWFGLDRYAGPWLLGSLFFAAALANTALRLRPDPLVVAGGLADGTTSSPRRSLMDSLRVIASIPAARLALLAMAVSQGAMVAVMAMTPVHMKLHGHEGLSPYVVSLHIAGMYMFTPLIGRFADRRGRQPAIVVGAVLLVSGTMLSAASGDVEVLLFPSLWLIGLGWSFGLIGGSALLTESVPLHQRVGVQGSADLLMTLCGGVAGLTSGFVRRAVGFHMLANLSTLAAFTLLVVAWTAWQRRTPRAAPISP